MTQNLIISSIFLSSSLLYSGCSNKNQSATTQISSPPAVIQESYNDSAPPLVEESITATTIDESSSSTDLVPPPTPQSEGKIYNMKSVQGEIIRVKKMSRGFTFPEYNNKIVLVQVFGKECSYCFEEMPTINRIQSAYRDRLSIIAIQAQTPMSKEEAFEVIAQHNMNYPIIDRDEAKTILVFLRDVYNWRGILPYTLLIKDGQIEQVFQGGEKSFEEISQGINDIN